MYIAIINVPGYLPMDDDPPVFDTAAEAWWYLYHERCDSEWDAELATGRCEGCGVNVTDAGGDWQDHDDDSETGVELGKRARHAASGLVTDFEACGTVYGTTPGYDGSHDLGIAYSVSEVES